MKNTFGGLVKTRKLWESGWAIRERKTKQNNNKQKEPRKNPYGKSIVNISKKKENNQTKSEGKKKKKKKKKRKKSRAGRLETRSWKDLSPQF